MLATALGYDDNKRVRVNRRSFYYPDRFEPVDIESLSRRCQAVILPDGTEMTYDGVEVNTQNAARFDTEVRRWAETNRYRLPYPTVEIESVDWFWDWNDDRHVQAARVTYYPATYHIRIMLNAQPHSPCLSRLISKQKADPIDAYLAFYEDGNDWVITRLPVGIGLRSGPYTLSKNHDYPLSPQLR